MIDYIHESESLSSHLSLPWIKKPFLKKNASYFGQFKIIQIVGSLCYKRGWSTKCVCVCVCVCVCEEDVGGNGKQGTLRQKMRIRRKNNNRRKHNYSSLSHTHTHTNPHSQSHPHNHTERQTILLNATTRSSLSK